MKWVADYTVGLIIVVAHLVMVAFSERRARIGE
jgi:hypothetical protein